MVVLTEINRSESVLEGDVSTGWYEWILENYIAGFSSEDLIKKVVEVNPYNIEAVKEVIKSTDGHPLVSAFLSQNKRLKRREWLLDILGEISQISSSSGLVVGRVTTPDFQEFKRDYYCKNIPVILLDGMKSWPALDKWSPKYLKDNYGDALVEIQFGREGDKNYEMYSPQYKKNMLLRDYVDLVMSGKETDDYYMTGNNTKNNMSSLSRLYEDIGDFGNGYRNMSIHAR